MRDLERFAEELRLCWLDEDNPLEEEDDLRDPVLKEGLLRLPSWLSSLSLLRLLRFLRWDLEDDLRSLESSLSLLLLDLRRPLALGSTTAESHTVPNSGALNRLEDTWQSEFRLAMEISFFFASLREDITRRLLLCCLLLLADVSFNTCTCSSLARFVITSAKPSSALNDKFFQSSLLEAQSHSFPAAVMFFSLASLVLIVCVVEVWLELHETEAWPSPVSNTRARWRAATAASA